MKRKLRLKEIAKGDIELEDVLPFQNEELKIKREKKKLEHEVQKIDIKNAAKTEWSRRCYKQKKNDEETKHERIEKQNKERREAYEEYCSRFYIRPTRFWPAFGTLFSITMVTLFYTLKVCIGDSLYPGEFGAAVLFSYFVMVMSILNCPSIHLFFDNLIGPYVSSKPRNIIWSKIE